MSKIGELFLIGIDTRDPNNPILDVDVWSQGSDPVTLKGEKLIGSFRITRTSLRRVMKEVENA